MKPDTISNETVHNIIWVGGIIGILGVVLMLKGLALNTSSMTNDEIISEVKKCRDANLVGQVVFDKAKRNVVKVQCITKIKETVEGPTASSEA